MENKIHFQTAGSVLGRTRLQFTEEPFMLGSIGTFRCPTLGCSRICFYHLVIIGWLLHYPQPLPCLHHPPKPSLAHTIIFFTFPLIPRPQLLDWWLSAWEPLPLKKWTKSSTNTSWLERARQARQCTLRRASFLMGETIALHKSPSKFHLTISTGPVLLYFYSIFAF